MYATDSVIVSIGETRRFSFRRLRRRTRRRTGYASRTAIACSCLRIATMITSTASWRRRVRGTRRRARASCLRAAAAAGRRARAKKKRTRARANARETRPGEVEAGAEVRREDDESER